MLLVSGFKEDAGAAFGPARPNKPYHRTELARALAALLRQAGRPLPPVSNCG
ncbi:hypothetical protein [Aquabacter spiritensis]|uniref:hypothetical protein n=1 Tax=Aquabacter spiritensis TaxID=933073 RepID=UPI001404C25C|nr:hypothetical protein [Aquabacter spiritensis]